MNTPVGWEEGADDDGAGTSKKGIGESGGAGISDEGTVNVFVPS